MKKLLFFIPSLTRGGAERVMSNLANQFSRAGYDITFVLQEKVDDEYDTFPEVKKLYLPSDSDKSKSINRIEQLKNIRKAIIKTNPDVALSFLDRANQKFLIATIGLKIKKYCSVRSTFEVECSSWKKELIVRLLFPKADGIILQTQEIEKQFKDEGINIKSFIIPNQIAEEFFNREFHGQRKNIVSVGRLESPKNHKLLIEAFAKIADKTPENLLIYGTGSLQNELKSLISKLNLQDRIFLKGLTSDVPSAIIGSKLFVMSSDFEGSPNALLEAIALGIPSISTDCPCGGPKEIIEDGKNGFLVPVGNADALAQKMLYILSMTDNEIYSISECAKKSAEKYRPEIVFKKWKSVLLKD